MKKSGLGCQLTAILLMVFSAATCLGQNKVQWTRKIIAAQDICAFCNSPDKNADSIAVVEPWGPTYEISRNDFADRYLLRDLFTFRGSQQNFGMLARGGYPNLLSDTDDQIAWNDALSRCKRMGVAPTIRLGSSYFKGTRLVVSAEDSSLTLVSEPTVGRFFKVAYLYKMNEDGIFDIDIGSKSFRCRMDFQSEYDFTIPSKSKKHFPESSLVEILPDCYHVSSLRFGEFDIPHVVVKVVDEAEYVTLGFSLIRRLNCAVDFTENSALLIASEKPFKESDYLHRHDVELEATTHGARIVSVSRNGLLSRVLKKGDFVVAIQGRTVAGEFNFSIKESLAQAVVNGGCVRLVRNDKELDIDIPPNPQRIGEREATWEGKDR